MLKPKLRWFPPTGPKIHLIIEKMCFNITPPGFFLLPHLVSFQIFVSWLEDKHRMRRQVLTDLRVLGGAGGGSLRCDGACSHESAPPAHLAALHRGSSVASILPERETHHHVWDRI